MQIRGTILTVFEPKVDFSSIFLLTNSIISRQTLYPIVQVVICNNGYIFHGKNTEFDRLFFSNPKK